MRVRGFACWIIVILIADACGPFDSDYVPTEATFRKRAGQFMVSDARDVEPEYGNIDVDSLFGRYVVKQRTVASILRDIERNGRAAGWAVTARSEAGYSFSRVTLTGNRSSEVVRVVCAGRFVHVAWIQIDGAGTEVEAKGSVEGKWAERKFWPRFEASLE